MANQAPKPAPGQTTRVTVVYAAVVYSPQQHGPDEGKYRTLAERLEVLGARDNLDSLLSTVDDAMKGAVIDSVSRMLDEAVDPVTAISGAEWAVNVNPSESDYSSLPMQSILAGYGDRFRGWAAIAAHQGNVIAEDYTLFQAGLNAALEALADPAEPTVSFIPRLGADGQATAVEVITDYGSLETARCTLVTGDGGQQAADALQAAAQALDSNGSTAFTERVTAGCRTAVTLIAGLDDRILATDPASPNGLLDRTQLDEQLRSGAANSNVCAGAGPNLDQVTVINRAGTFAWTGPELCSSATSSIPQTQLDVLNEILAGTALLDQLVERGAVTLDGDGTIIDVVWRAASEECTNNMRTPVYAPTVDGLSPSNPATRLTGSQAQGAWVYLCGSTIPRGSEASASITPWDWPSSNPPGAKTGQRARCHLIANILGGSGGEPANLVTCFQRANNAPYMKQVELLVREFAKRQDIFYLVTPQYNGRNGGLSGIRIVALGSKGLHMDVCVKSTVIGGWVFNGPC